MLYTQTEITQAMSDTITTLANEGYKFALQQNYAVDNCDGSRLIDWTILLYGLRMWEQSFRGLTTDVTTFNNYWTQEQLTTVLNWINVNKNI